MEGLGDYFELAEGEDVGHDGMNVLKGSVMDMERIGRDVLDEPVG